MTNVNNCGAFFQTKPSMKNTWVEEFDRIHTLLQQSDPMGLIASGASDDEYEIEALEIFLRKMQSALNENTCAEQIGEVFTRSFGEVSFGDEMVRKLATAILN